MSLEISVSQNSKYVILQCEHNVTHLDAEQSYQLIIKLCQNLSKMLDKSGQFESKELKQEVSRESAKTYPIRTLEYGRPGYSRLINFNSGAILTEYNVVDKVEPPELY